MANRDTIMDDFGISQGTQSVVQYVGHGTAVGAILTTMAGWLPPAVALLGMIWYGIQIYESRTFQHWKNNLIMKHRAKKLAKLRAKAKIALAEIDAMETVRAARVEAREMVEVARTDAAKLVVKEITQAAENAKPI